MATLRCRPGESRDEFIKRVVEAAARPNPDQLVRLAYLLRSGKDQCSKASATVEEEAG